MHDPHRQGQVGGRLGRRLVLLGIVLSAAVVAVMGLRGSAKKSIEGARTASARETIHISSRAVAVAEAGTALRWRIDRSETRIEQSSGDAFYRIDRGGHLTVETPRARVYVPGTCFRLALREGALEITVYEGRVEVEAEGRTDVVEAGGTLRL